VTNIVTAFQEEMKWNIDVFLSMVNMIRFVAMAMFTGATALNCNALWVNLGLQLARF